MATKKQQAEFNKKAEKYLQSIGAEFVRENEYSKSFKLNTVCGLLNIHLDQPEKSEIFSICCRFDDEKEAAKYLQTGEYGRLNKYSGKWNWHTRDGDQLLKAFEIELAPLLLTKEKEEA